MDQTIEIIIVDDHEIFIQGLESLLKEFSDFKVIGRAFNGQELLDKLKILTPDIVILDLKMPVMDGEEALKILSVRHPNMKVIILSMHFDEGTIEELYKLGVSCFLPKQCSITTLETAIRSVMILGKNLDLSLSVLQDLDDKLYGTDLKISNLSDREIDVLKLTCKGKRNKHIADILNITLRTVEFHKTNIYKKINCDTTADLINYCHKNGIK